MRRGTWDSYQVTADCFVCDCSGHQMYYDSTCMVYYDPWGKISSMLCHQCYDYKDTNCEHCNPHLAVLLEDLTLEPAAHPPSS
jgi:hypothetical protein